MLTLSDKSFVVMGVANKRSIAASIVHKLDSHGARLALSFLDDGEGKAQRRVEQACHGLSPSLLAPCDLNEEEEIQRFFSRVGDEFSQLDGLVHSVAFAPLDDIKCATVDVTRQGFLQAMESSVYSFIASARAAAKYMPEGGSLVTLSYFGAEKVVPGYNLMGLCKSALESAMRYLAQDLGPKGIRVNAVSAGALKTLASSAISGFQSMLSSQGELSPLSKDLSPDDVAKAVCFLLSDEASSITGEVLHVDCGLNIMAALPPNKKE